MTRFMAAIFCAGSLVCVSAQPHSEEEVIRMVERGAVDLTRLVVKLVDDSRATPFEKKWRAFEVSPLFSRSPAAYQQERRVLERRRRVLLPQLDRYRLLRTTRALASEDAIATLKVLYADDEVEFAYFEPLAENAVAETGIASTPLDRSTEDYEGRQFHLEAAPRGVDAKYLWGLPGGTGELVRVIDIEFGWEVQHEDFRPPFWVSNGNNYRDHGTAVWGEVAAKRDGQGVTGIAHDALFGVHAYSSAADYDRAAAKLSLGDILIIEQHQPGPDASKYAPMEYWRANFDAMKIATSKGIIVIAAAGNGDSNLDGAVYGRAFDLTFRDSGCLLIGAAGAPGDGHLQRLSFSNYGSRIDAFGYGNNVVTTGYGDLFNAGNQRKYTAKFSGTSSATPIVAGAVAALQSAAKSRGRVLSPMDVREALRKTGSPQAGSTAKRIGNLPDLKALAARFYLAED